MRLRLVAGASVVSIMAIAGIIVLVTDDDGPRDGARDGAAPCAESVRDLPSLPTPRNLPTSLERARPFEGPVSQDQPQRPIYLFADGRDERSLSTAVAVIVHRDAAPSDLRDDLADLAAMGAADEGLWDLGQVGPLELQAVMRYREDLDATLVVLGRQPAGQLAEAAAAVQLTDESVRLAGASPDAFHRSSHVPGFGSLPLSEQPPIRVATFTNDATRAEDEPQLAAVIGAASACGREALDVFEWWYGDHVVRRDELGRLWVRYPSPAMFGDVNLVVWEANGTIFAFATYGLPGDVFDAAVPAAS